AGGETSVKVVWKARSEALGTANAGMMTPAPIASAPHSVASWRIAPAPFRVRANALRRVIALAGVTIMLTSSRSDWRRAPVRVQHGRHESGAGVGVDRRCLVHLGERQPLTTADSPRVPLSGEVGHPRPSAAHVPPIRTATLLD